MREGYADSPIGANRGLDSSRLGSTTAGRQASTLISIIGMAGNRIEQIRDRQNVMQEALCRLANPRQVPVTGNESNKISRDPVTIEDQLEQLVRQLDQVLSIAHDQADTLNTAI